MKYKIQTRSPFGWSDIKSSNEDDDTYSVEFFASKKEAEIELIAIVSETNSVSSDYRIVEESVVEDSNLY